MTPKYMSDCVKLLLKLTFCLKLVFSTSSTTQCAPKKAETDISVIRNVGIKLCQLKCVETAQCLSIEYNIDTLTCRLSREESKNIKKKDGYVIIARTHSHVPTDSCASITCGSGQRCLKTRSGKSVCVQDGKQNYPKKSPHPKADKQRTNANRSLHEACRKGDLKRVRHTLSQCFVDINSREEKHGMTPLMLAAKEGHCEIYDFLIKKGANTSIVDHDSKNALNWACKGGNVSMVECVLRQYGMNIKNKKPPPLMYAASRGNTDLVEFLVCTGISNMSQVDSSGRNILHYACFSGNMALVKDLFSQGTFDIYKRSKHGNTPFMEAVSGKNTDVLKFLVSKGANVSDVDEKGQSVLHLAISNAERSVLEYLLSEGNIDINSKRKDGRTPLMEAAYVGHIDYFKLLMSKGANVSSVDGYGTNILHLAFFGGNVKMVNHILSQNLVDMNARNIDGETAAMLAKRAGNTAVYDLLVSKGCPVK